MATKGSAMRANKPVSLTVHKNTLEKRRARNFRNQFLADAKMLANSRALDGYSITVWDKDMDAQSQFDTGKTIPAAIIPDFVGSNLKRLMGIIDAQGALGPDDDTG